MLILMTLELFVIFVGNQSLVNLFRSFFFGVAILSVLYSMAMTGRRVYLQIKDKGPFYAQETPSIEYWKDLLDQCLFELGGLIFNLTILVMSGICPWKNQLNGEEKHDILNLIDYLNGPRARKWIFRCLIINAFFSIAATFSTAVIKVFFWVLLPYSFMIGKYHDHYGYKIVLLRLVWIITFFSIILIGLITVRYIKKKK